MTKNKILLAFVLALVLAPFAFAASVAMVGSSEPAAGPPAAEPSAAVDPHAVAPTMRLVVVSRARPTPSRPGQPMHGRLVGGPMPADTAIAQVLTDEDCAPDAAGISNCRNRMRLEDGREIVIRHPHDMRKVPCLSPGERVAVQPGAAA